MSAIEQQSLALFQQQYYNLFQFIKTRTHCEESARDVMQELYLKWQKRPRHKELSNPAGYLMTMAQNLLIERARKQQEETGQEAWLESAESNHGTPEQQAINQNLIERMQQALSLLPPDKQDLLWLSRVQGLSNREIAQQKNKSLSWVEKSLSMALLICCEIDDENHPHG